MIEITPTGTDDPLTFRVVVRADGGESRHEVKLARADYDRLTDGRHTPEQCIDAAFRFLLEREPKEAILRTFDVAVISRYFPEFEREFSGYLASGSGSS
jgi:hypothetical protein